MRNLQAIMQVNRLARKNKFLTNSNLPVKTSSTAFWCSAGLASLSADVKRMGFSTDRIAVWFLDRKWPMFPALLWPSRGNSGRSWYRPTVLGTQTPSAASACVRNWNLARIRRVLRPPVEFTGIFHTTGLTYHLSPKSYFIGRLWWFCEFPQRFYLCDFRRGDLNAQNLEANFPHIWIEKTTQECALHKTLTLKPLQHFLSFDTVFPES